MSQGPLTAYEALLAEGTVQPDPMQRAAAEKLQALHEALSGHRPAARPRGLRALFAKPPAAPPKGVYMHGPAGRGKSMLMDLFFAVASGTHKRRTHFHPFMVEVHDAMHRLRPEKRDPIPRVAAGIAEDAHLLCFDEFQVTNIADAMILGRLFEALLDQGVVVVATSNFPPGRLYEGGLQRDRFLPFIALIERRLDTVELAAEIDYRQVSLVSMPIYHTPLGSEADAAIESAFRLLTADAPAGPETLSVKSHTLPVPQAAAGVALFTFDELCSAALGAEDYLALAARYHTLVLRDIPCIAHDMRNEARRFIHLIDVLYEHRVNLVASAEAPPATLHPEGIHAFEFQRTASRLVEMQGRDYIQADHNPGGGPA